MAFGLHRDLATRFERIELGLATMGGVVEAQLADAVSAFERRDVALADDVVGRDRKTDAHERAVEQSVIDLLESRRLAPDALRRAMGAVKIAAEMERVGDLAKNVAHRTRRMAEEDAAGALRGASQPVARMGRAAHAQLSAALDALFRSDPVAARAVRDGDDRVDDLYNSVFGELVTVMGRRPTLAPVAVHLIFAAKNIERVGDHATNIAERVHYAITGRELTEDRVKTDATSMLSLVAE